MTTSESRAEIDAVVKHYYLVVDCGLIWGCEGPQLDLLIMWFYEESNGFFGLQRNDEIVSDTCFGAFPSDTIIF